jgi:hypothetical protein
MMSVRKRAGRGSLRHLNLEILKEKTDNDKTPATAADDLAPVLASTESLVT